jgi:hypothetical protein
MLIDLTNPEKQARNFTKHKRKKNHVHDMIVTNNLRAHHLYTTIVSTPEKIVHKPITS